MDSLVILASSCSKKEGLVGKNVLCADTTTVPYCEGAPSVSLVPLRTMVEKLLEILLVDCEESEQQSKHHFLFLPPVSPTERLLVSSFRRPSIVAGVLTVPATFFVDGANRLSPGHHTLRLT